MLKNFTFGFSGGVETYQPQTDDNSERVFWYNKTKRVTVWISGDVYTLDLIEGPQDKVSVRQGFFNDCRQIAKKEFRDFDPMLIKCIALQWLEVPAEVTA